ncbi:MAG: methyltransferase family protein [Promethearchaeota archaeon]
MDLKYKNAFMYSGSSLILMLLGWIGIDFINFFPVIFDFFKDPIRTCTLIIQISGFFLMGLFLGYGKTEKKEGSKVDMQDIVTQLSFIGPAIIHYLGPCSERYTFLIISNGVILRYIGFISFIISFIPMVWAPIYLGEFFSLDIEIQEGHELITTGPFRFVRNPKYFGFVLYFFSFSFIFLSIISIIIAILEILFVVWRIRDEEKILSEEFGEEWENYCKKTKWRLFPLIW